MTKYEFQEAVKKALPDRWRHLSESDLATDLWPLVEFMVLSAAGYGPDQKCPNCGTRRNGGARCCGEELRRRNDELLNNIFKLQNEKRALEEEMAQPDSFLTFAEAMAMDPSEVEFLDTDGKWRAIPDYVTLSQLRKCKFRRVRPKRSRVEDMAQQLLGDFGMAHTVKSMEYAICAVCEYLKGRSPDERGPAGLYVGDIEREFLR